MAEGHERNVMLAAGGTGGHLFPAYALSEELGRRGFVVDLVTDMRGDRYGTGFPARKVYKIPSATLAGKSPIAVVKTATALGRGILAARKLMGEVRPQAVIGFGGYPTFPPLLAANAKGIPTGFHEQNAIMGRANRMLAKRVHGIALSFPNTKLLDETCEAKATLTGNPVRQMVSEAAQRPFEPIQANGPINLVVFGGSQGARVFSDIVPEAIGRLPEALRQRVSLTQQAREEDVARVTDAYRQHGVRFEVNTFFANLPQIMAESHLVIARSGASSVAELSVLGRPSILVPLPHALDNDQLLNATQLADAGGAWCVEQTQFTPDYLAGLLRELCDAPERLEAAAHAAKGTGKPDAVVLLGDFVEWLIARRST